MGLGNIVTEARKRLGISQEDLATLSGLDRRHITRIEGADNGASVRTSTLEKLAKAFGLSVVELLRGRAPRRSKSADLIGFRRVRLSDEERAEIIAAPSDVATRKALAAKLKIRPGTVAIIQRRHRQAAKAQAGDP